MPEPDREAYEAAERLVREASARAEEAANAAAASTPPNGWSSGADRPDGTDSAFPDVTALLALVEGLRGTLPPELARQLADALRELLIAIRSVLDYTIERLDHPPGGGAAERDVEDIPIR
jgi:hypothetical protein